MTTFHDDALHDVDDASQSESESDDDQTYDDWIETGNVQCQSLFDDKVLPSVALALEHDRSAHGFDLQGTCASLGWGMFFCIFTSLDR